MKRTLTLLTGSLLLAHSVSAQSGSPPRHPPRVDLFKIFKGLTLASLLKPDTPSSTCPISEWGVPPGHEGKVSSGRDEPASWSLDHPVDPDSLRVYCEKLVNAKRRIYYLTDEVYRMSLQLRGIYTCEETIFLQMSIFNHSNLDFDVDSIRFFITDMKKPAGKAARSFELSPLYVYGDERIIKGKRRENCVIALPKFTLPPGKQLIIRVSERNGGRHLQLQADNFALLRARLA